MTTDLRRALSTTPWPGDTCKRQSPPPTRQVPAKREGRLDIICFPTQGDHVERSRLHPRVHRHPGPQPGELHAPHDSELEPDRAGRAPPTLLWRVVPARVHRRVAPSREHVGRRRLGGARRVVRDRGSRSRCAEPQAREVVGHRCGVPPRGIRSHHDPCAMDPDHRRALRRRGHRCRLRPRTRAGPARHRR